MKRANIDVNTNRNKQNHASYIRPLKINFVRMKCNALTKIIVFCFVTGLFSQGSNAQIVVGLDHWFNHEINAQTGKSYHYLWNDSAITGFSKWGQIFNQLGAKTVTVGHPDPGSLHGINIYILVDPDTTSENPHPNYILPQDVNAITAWVRKGGVLLILANDPLNCEFTHLNQLSSRFGIVFEHRSCHDVTGDQWEMGAYSHLPDYPVFTHVHEIFLKGIAPIHVSGAAQPVLVQNNRVFMAASRFGKGFVFAVGDPWLYNEYIDHRKLPERFDNYKAAMNLSRFLMKQTGLLQSK